MNAPLRFAVYMSLFIAITIIYYLLATRSTVPKKSMLVGMLIISFAVLLAYPPIYDPLYYHAASWLWGVMHINPYTDMISFFSSHQMPYVQVPVFNNYAYGPIWLLLTDLTSQVVQYHLIAFLSLLKGVALFSIIATALIVSKENERVRLTKQMFVLAFNPVTLLYILPAGTQEALLTLLLIAGLTTLKRSPFISISLLTTATLIKFSAAPILLLAVAWIISQAIHTNIISWRRSLLQICMPVFALSLITVLIFGLNSNYLDGVRTIASYDQFNLINLPWLLTKTLTDLTPISFTPIILKIAFVTAFNSVYIFLVLIFIFNLLKKGKYNDLLRYSWIILLAAIVLSGIHPQPWYYFPPLAISLLLRKKYIRRSIIITTSAIFAVLSLELLKVIQEDPTARLGIAVFTVLAYTIPPLYYMYKDTVMPKKLQLLRKHLFQPNLPPDQ